MVGTGGLIKLAGNDACTLLIYTLRRSLMFIYLCQVLLVVVNSILII